MSGAIHIVGATMRQILGTRRILLFGALALVPSFIFFLGSDGEQGASLLQGFLDTGSFHFLVAAPVTTLILSAAALGAERRDQTLSFVALRPISRSAIGGAKMTAAFLAAFSLNATGAAVMGAVYGVRSDDWRYFVPLLVGSAIATAIYTAFFVPLGYLTERSTLIGLAYLFVWEDGIVGAIGTLGISSPWRIGYAAFTGLAPLDMRRHLESFVLLDLSPGLVPALVRTAVFLAISGALLTWILRRRDLV